MEIRIELAYDRPQEVIHLFTEYTDTIITKDTEVAKCLNSQHYDDEVKELGEKYGLPNGRLYLAYLSSDIVGCAALRQLDFRFCEMKRLYVRPGYRGKHIGNALIEQVIADARQIGYKHMRLDTFPFMDRAIQMYYRYGFYKIERYNDNPASTAVFMQLDL
ncbi:GNAT family N-acetyltransferase [Lacrimispora sp.]|uniref:GNAT family N-acetyltransferase n=1 Tax=Lacrimispora sp. TaxID=2719234 RepID=UPI002860DCC6|nr:GNAT family N-acetyltransferase [Lacrimispora sp.]MDR7813556.1 GNAT family N-acetyltransferase [Lacrimispora sp.]